MRAKSARVLLGARRRTPGLAVLVLSQYVEERYGRELLESGMEGTGYLLKDRVADVGEFARALETVASGGTVLDPEVVGQLLARRRRGEGLSSLTPREGEVLALVAEGRTNRAVAEALFVTEGAVEKHVRSIFGKLGLPHGVADHRRVLAVLAYLRGWARAQANYRRHSGAAETASMQRVTIRELDPDLAQNVTGQFRSETVSGKSPRALIGGCTGHHGGRGGRLFALQASDRISFTPL